MKRSCVRQDSKFSRSQKLTIKPAAGTAGSKKPLTPSHSGGLVAYDHKPIDPSKKTIRQ